MTPVSIPLLHGRYRIEEQLGAGRLAVVYRAYDQRLQRQVLVHMLRKSCSARRRCASASFGNRTQCAPLASVAAGIFDSGEIASAPYMITEYVAGRTLRELGALSLEEALLYFRQLVGAVAVAQSAGAAPADHISNVILVEDGHVELLENWRTPAPMLRWKPPAIARLSAAPVASQHRRRCLRAWAAADRDAHRPARGAGRRPARRSAGAPRAQIPALSQIRPLLYSPALDELIQRATARDQPSAQPMLPRLGRRWMRCAAI